jgi:hypothetical protein
MVPTHTIFFLCFIVRTVVLRLPLFCGVVGHVLYYRKGLTEYLSFEVLLTHEFVTVHSGPCEEDGSCMWGLEFDRGRDPLSKGALDIWGSKVIKKDKNQIIALAVGT